MILAKAFQTDARPRQEARTLVDASYPVFAIAWDRAYEFKSSERFEGVLVRSFRLTKVVRSSPLGLAIGAITFQVVAFLMILRVVMKTRQRVTVHAHDLNTLGAAYLARIARLCRYVLYDCHEPSYATYSEVFGRVLGRVAHILEVQLISCADVAISVSEPIVRDLRRHIRDVYLIYNCPRLSDIPNVSKDEARSRLGLPDRSFIVSYVGSAFAIGSRLDIMMRVADLARDSSTSIRFLVVGASSSYQLRTQVAKHSNPAITFVGPKSHKDALTYRIASDLTWAVYDDPTVSVRTRIGAFWQIFESMACGVPIMVWKGTNMAALINRTDCGVAVDGNDAEGIVRNIDRLSHNPEMRARLSSNGRSASSSEYNWEKMSSRLLRVYKSLEGRKQ
jgi:glycosyltransferase involved in cell wall biosynthesis